MCKDLLSSVVETDFFELIKSNFWATFSWNEQLLSNFFLKWATFGQLLKIFGANFERYPSNLCKSLDTTEISFQLWSITAPLSDLTRNGQPNKVEWGEAQEKAYQTIKSYLTIEPILRLSDQAKTYFLWTDASSNGIGAVLMQRQIVKCEAQLLYHRERVPSDCMGNQEISSIFVSFTFFAADWPRAAEVHGQCKIDQRTTHAMGGVATKLQFQGGSH